MAASSEDRSALGGFAALGGALLLAAIGVLLTPGSDRGLAAVMAAVGLLAGVALAFSGLLPARRGRRTPIERLNDGAFVVVLAAGSLLLAITARPWTAALPGLVGGVLAGRLLRAPAADHGPRPPEGDR